MRIGILTFPTAINYGTALQAAALRKVLSPDINTVTFLNHRCKLIDSTNKVFDIGCALDIKYTIAHIYNLDIALKRTRNFKKFQNKYIPLSPDNPEIYDTVVAGSDQIWNYNLTDYDYHYFLDFPKNNTLKIAYAGSFGLSKIAESQKEKIALKLADFDYLSVREMQAAKIIKEIANIDTPVVCDPTLLLSKEEWDEMKEKTFDKTGYIFVYTVFNSEKIWEYAEKLSKETGLPIRTISYSKLHKRNAEYDFTAGPDRWLSHIMNADYVVTNSFHGLAFSINLEKNFFFDLPPEKSGVGSRLSDISQRYHLSDRNISGKDFAFTTEAPNFSTKRELLEQDKKLSFDFIDRFLK